MARKRKQQIAEAMDPGTPEMARRFTIVPKLSSPTETSMKVMNGDEVDKLLLHDVINPMQHATLLTLAKRLHGYGFVGLKSPDYINPPTHLDPELVSDKKAAKMRGAVHLIMKMDKHPVIQRERRVKLVNLVLQDAPWGKLRHQIEDLHHCILALDDIFLNRV